MARGIEFYNMEREKCIKYLFNILLQENKEKKEIAEMLIPMKQVDGYVCSEINRIIESEAFRSILYDYEECHVPTLIIRDAPDMYYKIEFDYKEYWDGYCECKPIDEGYNAEHRCCGLHCDWGCPIIRIEKIYELQDIEFEGEQRDLWKAIDSFLDEQSDDLKDRERNKILSEISWREREVKQLREYEKQLEELQRKLKELE